MSDTARFALPLLESGQAQKELTHNEALALIDIGLHTVVEAAATNTPPASPLAGQCWIVGSAPTEEWAGRAGSVAGWTAGGWRFLPARDGMAVWNRATGRPAARMDGTWEDGVLRGRALMIDGQQVVGARRAAVPAPSGGTVIDVEARAAIQQILAALTAHGLLGA